MGEISEPISAEAAYRAFDRVNALDPNTDVVDGRGRPAELVYAERMTEWLERLYPDASLALRLAARCQHIERWKSPRESYPEGRAGYLAWRGDLKRFHSDRAAEVLRQIDCDEDLIARVQSLVRKERLKRDAEAQALEDVVCMVFLVHHFEEFALKHSHKKVIDILRKTWSKMSDHGQRVALEYHYSGAPKALIAEALDLGSD